MDEPTSRRIRKVLRSWSTKTLLAASCYAKAQGEGIEGLRAVAHVVVNRVKRKEKDARDIILAPQQFSWTNPTDPNLWRVLEQVGKEGDDQEDEWKEASEIALRVLAGQDRDDPTHGADHYANVLLVKKRRGGTLPAWLQQAISRKQKAVTISRHTFFKLWKA